MKNAEDTTQSEMKCIGKPAARNEKVVGEFYQPLVEARGNDRGIARLGVDETGWHYLFDRHLKEIADAAMSRDKPVYDAIDNSINTIKGYLVSGECDRLERYRPCRMVCALGQYVV